MDLVTFCLHIGTTEKALQYLREKNVLRSSPPTCIRSDCLRMMTEVKHSVSDGVIWRCPSHKGCKTSVRVGSFLSNSNLSLTQFCMLAYTWSYSTLGTQEEMCGVSSKTVIDWNQLFRNVCSKWLVAHPITLGGVGQVVEIDEFLMARGKRTDENSSDKWVFAMYDIEQKIGLLQFVTDRSREVLLPIIEHYVLPGSIIHSDCWQAYTGGAIHAIPVTPPYQHLTVNHTQNFVDPQTNACTNHVLSFWKNAKAKYKVMNGTTSKMLPGYLDEFMWRQIYGRKGFQTFQNLLEQISILYPV